MIKAIVFDFFDVIRDDGFNRWLRLNDLTLSGAVLELSKRNDRGEFSGNQMFAELGALIGQTADEVEYVMEHGNEYNSPLIDYIAELGRTHKIGLLSNSESAYLRRELAENDLERLFDTIVISSEVGAIKPEPAIFAIVLERLGVTADECVFVDDNPRHIAGATAAGIHGILFSSTEQLKQALANSTG